MKEYQILVAGYRNRYLTTELIKVDGLTIEEAALKAEKSTYIRLTGSSNNPIIYNKDYDFKIGKSVTLKDGKDIVIFCAGAITKNCLIRLSQERTDH